MEFLQALYDLAMFDGVLLSKYTPLSILIPDMLRLFSVVNIDFI